jgi:hypothetical protein
VRCNFGQDAAPHGAIDAAIVIEDNDAAGRYVVDVVADGARHQVDRFVAHRERTSQEPGRGARRSDAERAARQAELVQRIGYLGGGQQGIGLGDRRGSALDDGRLRQRGLHGVLLHRVMTMKPS